MYHKKLFTVILISDAALFTIFVLLKWILNKNHLSFRNAVNCIVYTALAVLTLAVFAQTIFAFFKVLTGRQSKRLIRILAGAGITAIFAAIAFASLNILIRGVFSYQPEHIVEKDDRTMLARVDSFLQVEVRYYEHVNALVRGSRILIHEDFGNGGYAPFEMDDMPKVQRYIYYDENGEISKSIWYDCCGAPLSADDASKVA